MQSREGKHVNTELLMELLVGSLEEEGYEVKRYSDSANVNTTDYDGLAIKGSDGNYYNLIVEECYDHRHPTGEMIPANDTFMRI